MPTYNDLRPEDDLSRKDYALVFPELRKQKTIKKRIVRNLLSLKLSLDRSVATRRSDENLIVASWNIKEFGHTSQRLPESYFYIAEVISRFDLVAIQEIKSGLQDLHIIMQLLGDDWGYMVNDITEGTEGNSERSCYIFNRSRVQLAGLAGELVLWDKLTEHSTLKQLKRTPYFTGFTAGWKTFALLNLHLHPGKDTKDLDIRRAEVTLLLDALAEKRSKDRLWSENIIIVGDFNFYTGSRLDEPTVKLIHEAGYHEVQSLVGVDTNVSQTAAYDRLFLTSNEYFTLGQNRKGQENGGVFNPFETVFTDEHASQYKQDMKAVYGGPANLDEPDTLLNYYRRYWRRNQISDHLPIWIELITDSSPVFLERVLQSY